MWLPTAPAVTIMFSPAITSVAAPTTNSGSTPSITSGFPALPTFTMRPSHGHADSAGSAEHAEKLHQVHAVVGLLGVKADHQRVFLRGVERLRKVHRVRLVRIVYARVERRHLRTRPERLRHQGGQRKGQCGEGNPLGRPSHRNATSALSTPVRRGTNPPARTRPGVRALPSRSTPSSRCLRAPERPPASSPRLPGRLRPPSWSGNGSESRVIFRGSGPWGFEPTV